MSKDHQKTSKRYIPKNALIKLFFKFLICLILKMYL